MVENKAQAENEVYRHKDTTDSNLDDTMAFYKPLLTEDKTSCDGSQRNLNPGVFVSGELHSNKEDVWISILCASSFYRF